MTDLTDDQIDRMRMKLAKVMGVRFLQGELTGTLFGCPDPFTNANDDYAVLEWVRSNAEIEEWDYNIVANRKQRTSYQIGDYARALLEILDDN